MSGPIDGTLPAAPSAPAERLRVHAIQPTAQRLQIAAMLLATPQHVTAEQLLGMLRKRGARVSKATLYNTLRLFADRGLIRELALDGARVWFDSNVSPHYHFQDQRTGALADIATTDVAFERLPEPPAGMEIAGVDLVIRLRPVR
jgi:Fur family iron response transcriptional regulator